MKRSILFILFVAAAIACYLLFTRKNAAVEAVLPVETDSVAWKSAAGDSLSLRLDVPKSENKKLNELITNVICQMLQTEGATLDAKALQKPMEQMIDTLHFDEETLPFYRETEVKKTYETPELVTFSNTDYIFTGGAHGITLVDHRTILKNACDTITWRDFKNTESAEFKALLLEGLQKYFDVPTADAVNEMLIEPFNVPITTPCLSQDGVIFTWQQYEIAPYAVGIPQSIVSYEKIKPFLGDRLQKILTK